MTITVHHLGISQSERIVWLLEELGIDYKLILHTRDPVLAPKSLEEIPGNRTGKSPFIVDDTVSPPIGLNESGAICDYIIGMYGNGRFQIEPGQPNYAEYLYWFHYANASLLPAMTTSMFLQGAQAPKEAMMTKFAESRIAAAIQSVDDRLATNKWLAGDTFTAADIMSMFPLSTQRYYGPSYSLKTHSNVLRWLRDCAARPAFQKAMEKGDPEMEVYLHADPPAKTMIEGGGTKSDVWKKGRAGPNM